MRTWNLFHGNTFPPQRRGFLADMIDCATADQPDVLCVQEVPAWALDWFTVGDLASRPPLGARFGRLFTALHHGLIRGAVAGQGVGVWLAPWSHPLDRHVFVLNPRAYRRRQARALGLGRAARWGWARERRVVQVVRVLVGERRFVIANTHCTSYAGDTRIPDAELLRAAQFAASLALPEDVLVLAGDFNVRPGESQTLALLTGPDWGFSQPGPGIDHVLVRGAPVGPQGVWPDARRCGPDGALLSDHAPVDLEILEGMAYDKVLAERVRESVRGERGLSEKAMFGGLAFMVDGNMAVSASSQGGLLLRIDPARADSLTSEAHVRRFEMRGREMDGWLRVDTQAVETDDELRRWVDVGISYARSLVPK